MHISKRFTSWRLPGVFALMLLVLTALPYLSALTNTPPGSHFMGFLFLADDANTYLAKMRQGLEGNWAWTNRYTPNTTAGSYLFLFWLAWGHLAGLLHLSLYATFQLARMTGIIALVVGAWLFLGEFLQVIPARKWAWWFLWLVPGGGLLLLVLHEPVLFGSPTWSLDFHLPEWSPFFSALSLPHFTWAAACIAFGCTFTLRAAERVSWRYALLALAAWVGLASIHPQMLVFFALLFGIIFILRPVTHRGWFLAAGVGLAMLPYVLYGYWASQGSPEVARWLAQSPDNVVPSVFSLLGTLWPKLLVAGPGLYLALRRRNRRDLFLLAWLALELAILYVPGPLILRRRFLDGFYLPWAVWAGEGLYWWLPRLAGRTRNLVPFGYLALGAMMVAFLAIGSIFYQAPGAWLPNDQYGALTTLASQPAGEVFSDDRFGLYVPAYSPDSVYVGHYAESFDYFSKAHQVCQLYVQGDSTTLTALLQSTHARYWVWDATCASAAHLPFTFPFINPPGTLVYSQGTVRVYRLY